MAFYDGYGKLLAGEFASGGYVVPAQTTFMETEQLPEGIVNVYKEKDTQWGYWSPDGINTRTTTDNKYGWSGFMPIQPNCSISITYKIANGFGKNVFYYDADKNLLGTVAAYDTAMIDPIVVTDENARYIRFNVDGYFDTVVNTLLPEREKYVLVPEHLPEDTMRRSLHKDINKEKWRGKKIIVDGDSITDSGTGTAWHAYLKEWFGLSEVQNCAASGKTIIQDRGDGRTCLERVEQDYDADASAILLMGAGNSGTPKPGNEDDAFEDGTFYGMMNGLVDKLKELFPLMPIVLIATPPRNSTSTYLDVQCECLQTIAENKGIYFIDCFHGTLNPYNADNRSAYITDGTHPNAAGHKIIAQTIYEEMKRIGIPFA